jgi:hypothetical protein
MAPSAKVKTPATASKTKRPVTLKHLAAVLAEEHQLTKKAKSLKSVIVNFPIWRRSPASSSARQAKKNPSRVRASLGSCRTHTARALGVSGGWRRIGESRLAILGPPCRSG